MKNKNKKKILRFIAVFSIISILFVAFAFPISALDIGGGATLTGISSTFNTGDEPWPENAIYQDAIIESDGERISFQFNFARWSENYEDWMLFTNVSYYSFSADNMYGTLTLSLDGMFLICDASYCRAYVYNSVTNELVGTMTTISSRDSKGYTYTFKGELPARFHIVSNWCVDDIAEVPLGGIVTYNITYAPGDRVADKLDEEAYPSFDDEKDTIEQSQFTEEYSLIQADGFISSTFDFVFDRSLFSEGGFVKGLRVASTTFENFASIPFIGTILKYAVIFGLIGFVLGLATFVMRRRK